jgi:hypothetical protein
MEPWVTALIWRAINYSKAGATEGHLSLLYFAHSFIISHLPLLISVMVNKLHLHKEGRDCFVATPVV